MSNNSLPQSADRSASPTLAERVQARVAAVSQTLDGAGRIKPAQREARSVGHVYREMRRDYRRYRREMKRPAVPALRDAVQAFKRGPSVTSLVAVASFLDDRKLLHW